MTSLHTSHAYVTRILIVKELAKQQSDATNFRMTTSAHVASIDISRRKQASPATMIAIASFSLGSILIVAAIARWMLTLFGALFSETSSAIAAMIGLALFALGGHCLDVVERKEFENRR
jgi:hypothetical protein